MFDGNHRSRRTVNLGTSSRTTRQRQQQQQGISSASSAAFLKSTTSPTTSSSTNNQKLLLEETKRRREERRYHQLQNQSVTTIVKYYRGYKTRKGTTLYIEQQLDTYWIRNNHPTNTTTNDIATLIKHVTSLLNLRYRLQLPIVEQQYNNLRQPPVPSERLFKGKSMTASDDNNEILHRYVEFILKSSNGRLSGLQPPKAYTSHRIIRQLLRSLVQIPLLPISSLVQDEEHILLVLEYLVGVDNAVPTDGSSRMEIDDAVTTISNPQQQDEQINRWKRLGGGLTFQLLIDCYIQRFQQRHEQSSSRCLSKSDVTTAARFLSIIQQVIPQTTFGRALQGVLQLAVVDTIESTVMDGASLFLRLVEPILNAISTTRTSFPNVDGNSMAVDSDIKCINQLVDDTFLLQTIEQMITESPIQLMNNALTWYKREISQVADTNIVRRMTSHIVQLVHYCLLSSPGTEANTNQRILLTILLGRRVRGDELRLDQRQQRLDSFGAENDDDDDYIDDDYDTTEHDMATTAATTSAASTTMSDHTGTITTATTMGSQSMNPNSSSKKHKTDTANVQQRKMANPTVRFTRQDLQTTSKLDKQYSKVVQTYIHRSDDLFKRQVQQQQMILKIANELADPDLIMQWGRILLSSSSPSDPIDDFYKTGQESYVFIVGILLQLTTGLRSRQNYVSSFLSKLAFEQDYVSILWKYVLAKLEVNDTSSGAAAATIVPNSRQVYYPPSTYLAISVFCDLFAHSLIATKDDTFLDLYTTSLSSFGSASNSSKSGIAASDVIINVRDILYEVYWSKPVQLSDFTCIVPSYTAGSNSAAADDGADDAWISASRARVFLTGTKLWNSLYERWNRLVLSRVLNGSNNQQQHVICAESTWWFPKVTGALSSSNKVGLPRSALDERRRTARPVRRRNNNNHQDFADYDDADEMSIDSYDSDDSQLDGQAMRTGDEDPNVAAADAETDALAETFSDPKIARVLTCIPQSVPFERRVKLFDSLLKTDKTKSHVDEESAMHQAMLQMMHGEGDDVVTGMGRVQVEIRRDHMYEDSMRQLNDLGNSKQLKRRVRVSFINQHGTAEAGIDGGGVFKEFIDDLIKDAFSVNPTTSADGKKATTATYQLFTVTPLQTLRINSELFHSHQIDERKLLLHYEFLGRVLGKAVYESILVEPQFCLPFLNQLLGKTNTMEDLKNYDPEYYRNLTKLLQLSDVELESLGLTFELTFGSKNSSQSSRQQEHSQTFCTRTIELFPGGSQKSVTKDNVIQYIHLVAHQWLNVETSKPTKSFLRGFRDLIPASWVRLFSAYELQRLISGDDSVKGIDVESLKNSMQYAAGYHPSQQIIEWFWEIVEDMTSDQQHKLLKFMTSCSRQPLLGFGSLEPAPCIQQIRLPDELFASSTETILKQTPLPTASTCMNLLKLPNYRSKELMRLKLLAAIEAGAGFELT